VRFLVVLLFPVGIIDAAFTLATTWELGLEVEFNPIVRYLIAANLWLPWALLDIIGFALFSMLAGSYYLHTRNNPGGPDTTWITLIFALRVSMATYNVTYYYIPFVVAVYPPFWTSILVFALTYFGLGRVLNRRTDISQRGIIQYFRNRINKEDWLSDLGSIGHRFDDVDGRLCGDCDRIVHLPRTLSNRLH
jgi:hypothetical protein